MTKRELDEALGELPESLRFVFAPLVKRALGLATGIALGGAIAILTIYHQIFDPDHIDHLWLLTNFFKGYDPSSILGALIGFLWGAWVGFVAGWFLAAFRNFVVAVWIFTIKTRALLNSERDFLDHI